MNVRRFPGERTVNPRLSGAKVTGAFSGRYPNSGIGTPNVIAAVTPMSTAAEFEPPFVAVRVITAAFVLRERQSTDNVTFLSLAGWAYEISAELSPIRS
jgi:hypothetical protein